MSSSPPTGGWIARRLTDQRLPIQVALLAVVLCLPALDVGWQIDDNFHRIVLAGNPASDAHPLEIFSVMRGREELNRDYVDAGIFPWWTSERFHIAFVRFLSAATSWLDFSLWPRSAPLQHAHSLLWLGALVLAAALLYRRIEGSGDGAGAVTAGLAALLFAVDDAHGTAAGWLANRNALVAACFGVLCLLCHDRWRRDGRRAAAALAPLMLALSLLGGETGLGTAAFLLAYALCLDRGPLAARLLALAPAALVLGAWAALYRLLGFGARGSGLYLDPIASPAAFAAAAVERMPFLLAGQLTPLAADLGSLAPAEHRRALWWLATTLVGGLVLAFRPLFAASRTARFWALGALLATVPLCATFATNRVLLFTGLGATPLVAAWLVGPAGRGRGRRWPHRALAFFLIGTHLVLAPLLLPVTARVMKTFGEPIERAVLTLPADPALASQDLVVVNAPDYLTHVSQIPALFDLENRPRPRRIRGLAIGPAAVEARRVDKRSIDLTMADGFYGGVLGELYRPASEPFARGDRIELTGMSATVRAVSAAGRPLTVRFAFDRPLESETLRWMAFENGRFVSFEPPAEGEARSIPAAYGPFDALVAGRH